MSSRTGRSDYTIIPNTRSFLNALVHALVAPQLLVALYLGNKWQPAQEVSYLVF